MPFLRPKKHDKSDGNTVVVTTTTTTTTTTPNRNSNSQAGSHKPSLLSKLKSNNSDKHVTRETRVVPASEAPSRSSVFGRKDKSTAPTGLNNGIGARSNNPVYASTNGVGKKPGMGDRLKAKWGT